MIGLEWEMTYRLRSVGPMATTIESPWGAKQYWQMSDAELAGPRIRATAPYVGGDWINVGPDGLGRPNVRVQFRTDDGETVLLRYTGLVQATEAFNRAAETNGTTEFSDQNDAHDHDLRNRSRALRVAQSKSVRCRGTIEFRAGGVRRVQSDLTTRTPTADEPRAAPPRIPPPPSPRLESSAPTPTRSSSRHPIALRSTVSSRRLPRSRP